MTKFSFYSLYVLIYMAFQSLTFAVDVEFIDLNPTQAKKLGTSYKGQVANFVGTDIEALLDSYLKHSTAGYVSFIKKSLIALVKPWIDSLDVARAANARFVTIAVIPASLGAGKTDRSIKSFKEGLEDVINTFPNPAIPAPTSINMFTFKACRAAVIGAFVTEVNRWLDTLVANDFDNFLNNAVAGGHSPTGITKPAGRTRGDFKAAMKTLIESL
jgi:hypothetical protein